MSHLGHPSLAELYSTAETKTKLAMMTGECGCSIEADVATILLCFIFLL